MAQLKALIDEARYEEAVASQKRSFAQRCGDPSSFAWQRERNAMQRRVLLERLAGVHHDPGDDRVRRCFRCGNAKIAAYTIGSTGKAVRASLSFKCGHVFRIDYTHIDIDCYHGQIPSSNQVYDDLSTKAINDD